MHGHAPPLGASYRNICVGLNNRQPSNPFITTCISSQVHEGARSLGVTRFNNHVFICEYSQHILCHYVLIFLWFTIQLGILFSLIGFVLLLVSYCVDICGFVKQVCFLHRADTDGAPLAPIFCYLPAPFRDLFSLILSISHDFLHTMFREIVYTGWCWE